MQAVLPLSFSMALLVSVIAMQGCADMRPASSAAPHAAGPPPAACDGTAAQFALGRGFGPALERELRARSGASVVRWLSPGQAVTQAYDPARLSLTLDGRGRVVRAICG